MSSSSPSKIDILPSQCTAQITSTPHEEHPTILERITLKITHPHPTFTSKPVGTLSAMLIDRRRCRGQFIEIMDEESDEMLQLAQQVFDKYGNVRPWLTADGDRKGTGVWSTELNSGTLVYLENMDVDETVRNKGIGSWALQQLVASGHVLPGDFIVCWPCPIGHISADERKVLQEKQIAFFRKNDFRRIGRTAFFAYSPDPSHPSRQIPPEADATFPAQTQTSNSNSNAPTHTLTDEERVEQFPLHVAIASINDESVRAIIQTINAQDTSGALIRKRDENGITPIYIAAGMSNVHALRELIALGVGVGGDDGLTNRENSEGMTPLEKLEDSMRSSREFVETILGRWNGYSEAEILSELFLKRAMGVVVAVGSVEEYLVQRKWGCTCGKCAGGWLSPRMRFRLMCTSGFTMDTMPMSLDDFTRGEPLDLESFDNTLRYIPPHLHSQVFKSFYRGYQAIFAAIYSVFKNPTIVPSLERITSAVSFDRTDASFYFRKGGKVFYALDCVMDEAREQSALGDGEFEALYEDELDGAEYLALPACANDLEFEIVRSMLGLDPGKVWGPYRRGEDEDEDEDMDSDSDDDMD